MMQTIPWARTLGAKLSVIFIVLLGVSIVLVFANQKMLSSIKGDAAAMNQLGHGQTRAVEMQYLAYRLVNAPADQRSKWTAQLRDVIVTTDRRTKVLYEGDPALGVLPVSDPRVLSGLREREEIWRTEIKPTLERLIDAESAVTARATYDQLDRSLVDFTKQLEAAVLSYQRVSEEKVDRFINVQYWFVAIVVVILGCVFWLARGIVRRIRGLATTASQVGAGDLSLEATVEGNDEV